MIKRDFYLNQLIRNMHNGDIKVITGIRRSGKSVLLFELFFEYLLNQKVKEEQIIRIELDQRKFYQYRNPILLCDYVSSIVQNNKKTQFYLLIDEVQFTIKVKDSEHNNIEITIYDMLNELKAYKNLDVYVTGSNSKMLSKDVLTEFRGRATQIHIFPLCFQEFYSFVGGDKKSALEEFMLFGGMPKILSLQNESDKKKYLTNLFEELYIKDIIERTHLQREDIFNNLLDYLSSQIGSLTNATNVANALTSINHEQINNTLISNYIECAKDAFLISEAKRYDIKGKKYFNYPSKYYFTDIGLRNARLNYRQYDPGHIMENIIYNELIKRGFSVDVGLVTERTKNERIQREIDFIVNDGDRRTYIQSAYQMDTETKTDTELQSLKFTGDFFKKIIIRMDIPHNFYDNFGFFHCNLIDFLLDTVELF